MLSVSARPDAALSPWVARDPPIPRLGSQLTVDAGSAPGDDEPEVIRFLQDPALTTHTDLYLSGLPKELRKEVQQAPFELQRAANRKRSLGYTACTTCGRAGR